MKHLEAYIARYLDGEMSPSEVERFDHRLAGSSEMQTLLREMTGLRRAARRMPVLHVPSARLEASLFGRLYQEGLYDNTPPTAGKRALIGNDRRGRRRAVVFAAPLLLLMIILLGGYFGVNNAEIHVGNVGQKPSFAFSSEKDLRAPSLDLAPIVEAPVDGPRAEQRRRGGRNAAARGSSTLVPSKRSGLNTPTVIEGSLPYAANFTIPSHLSTTDPVAVPSRSYDLSAPTTADAAPPVPPVLIDYSRQRRSESATMVATLNGGMAKLSSGGGIAIRDMQMRVGLEFGSGDRLTMIVGSLANVTEVRHENMGPVSRPPGGVGGKAQLLAQPPSPRSIDIKNEAWLGIGYQHPVAEFGGVRVNLGASVGTSSSALRLGGDLSLSRKLTKSIAFELSGRGSQVIPYDRHLEQFTLFNSPDGYVYSGAAQRSAFYSYGLQAGIAVNLSH